jgi:hypothetical protein
MVAVTAHLVSNRWNSETLLHTVFGTVLLIRNKGTHCSYLHVRISIIAYLQDAELEGSLETPCITLRDGEMKCQILLLGHRMLQPTVHPVLNVQGFSGKYGPATSYGWHEYSILLLACKYLDNYWLCGLCQWMSSPLPTLGSRHGCLFPSILRFYCPM